MTTLTRWLTGALVGAGAAVLIASCSSDSGDGDPIEPDPKGSIQASVTGDGAALSGVTVRVFATGGSTALVSGSTGANGQTTFAELEPGTYDVEVVVLAGFELASGEMARKPVTVVAEQTATVSFALEEIVVVPTEGQIRARVVDGTTGVAGVEVMLFAAGGATPLATLTTAADGRVLFTALTPEDYEVAITLPEGFVVEAGDTTRKAATVTAGVTTDVEFGVVGPEDTVVEIELSGTSFTPDDVTIEPGTTVRWVNVSGDHTVTPDGHTEWNSTVLDSNGETFEHRFDSVGTFDYFCIPHQSLGMTGVVRVE